MITVTFHCGGCFAKAEGTKPLGREFVSLTGRSHGFGSYRYDTAHAVVPDGWIAYDIIGATYCPACAGSLSQEPTPVLALEVEP